MKYTPKPVPATMQRDAASYLGQELNRLRDVLNEFEVLQFAELNAEPARLADGMLAYADGSNWNPGQGAGLYFRDGAAWESLVGLQPDENETISGDWTFTGALDVSASTITGLSSDDLSDVASIAMLDEAETVTGAWTFNSTVTLADGVDIIVSSNDGMYATETTGTVQLDFDTIVGDGTSDSTIRFHRSTNTTGEVDTTVYRGDGTTSAVTITRYDNTLNFGSFMLRNATRFYLYNSTNADYQESWHNGTDVYNDFVNTTWFRFRELGGGVLIQDGGTLRVYDTTDADYLELSHTGTLARIDTNAGAIQFDEDINITENTDLRLACSTGTIQTTSGRIKAELQTIADDATGVFMSANNSSYRLYILVTSYNATATGMWFSTTTQAPQIIFAGSRMNIGTTTNPDIDGEVNVWQSSSTAVSIKNRLGSSRTFTLYSIGL